MKEKYYYIGEVSSLLDISTQTLRYYDKIGLVRPAKVNEQNGYRQYTYDQIHYIERIKYLQKLGLPLTEIRMALDSGGTERLTELLTQHKEELQRKIEALQDTVDTIDWYVSYYNYLMENAFPDIPFKKTFETRYVLAAPIYPGEPIYGAAGYRLTEAQSKTPFNQLPMLRQNGYILDFHRLLQRRIPVVVFDGVLKFAPFNIDGHQFLHRSRKKGQEDFQRLQLFGTKCLVKRCHGRSSPCVFLQYMNGRRKSCGFRYR